MNALSTDVQTDAQRVAKMVAGMAEILGVNAPTARIVGYVEALRDIPPNVLASAIKRAIQGWRYPDMPKPADIRAAADAVEEAERDDQRRRGEAIRAQLMAGEFALFGRVPKMAVIAKFGRLTAPDRCACGLCVEAGVSGPPRLVPGGYVHREGELIEMGVWLHGYELAEHERGQAAFESAMRSVFARYQPEADASEVSA
jgi:hypothetical protein